MRPVIFQMSQFWHSWRARWRISSWSESNLRTALWMDIKHAHIYNTNNALLFIMYASLSNLCCNKAGRPWCHDDAALSIFLQQHVWLGCHVIFGNWTRGVIKFASLSLSLSLSMYLCVCVCVSVWVWVWVGVCVCVCTWVCGCGRGWVYVRVCVCVCTYVCVCAYVYIYIYVCIVLLMLSSLFLPFHSIFNFNANLKLPPYSMSSSFCSFSPTLTMQEIGADAKAGHCSAHEFPCCIFALQCQERCGHCVADVYERTRLRNISPLISIHTWMQV